MHKTLQPHKAIYIPYTSFVPRYSSLARGYAWEFIGVAIHAGSTLIATPNGDAV